MKFIKHNPNCYCCPNKSRVVDHIFAHKSDEKLFWDVTNFMPLCITCHNFITASFDRYIPPKTEEKMKWLNEMRLQHGIGISVKVVPRKKDR